MLRQCSDSAWTRGESVKYRDIQPVTLNTEGSQHTSFNLQQQQEEEETDNGQDKNKVSHLGVTSGLMMCVKCFAQDAIDEEDEEDEENYSSIPGYMDDSYVNIRTCNCF